MFMGLLWHAQAGCLTEMNCTPQNANVSLRVHAFPSEGLWEGSDEESVRPVASAQFERPATQRSGCVGCLSYLRSVHGQASQAARQFPSYTGGPHSVITPIKSVIGSLESNWLMIGSDT